MLLFLCHTGAMPVRDFLGRQQLEMAAYNCNQGIGYTPLSAVVTVGGSMAWLLQLLCITEVSIM
jgi:hypothetical protein